MKKQIIYKMNGEFVGIKEKNRFYSYSGISLGVFNSSNELFDFEGNYIGELYNSNRLLFNKSHSNHRGSHIAKSINYLSMSIAKITPMVMPMGCRDFDISKINKY
jgi:hypothetical protein